MGFDSTGLGRARVLIVDDEAINIGILANLLRTEHEVVAAKSGPLALKLCRSGSLPDLVLLDVTMPDMDGYEVCRQLKAHDATRNIPVIFVTGRSDAEDEVKGLELGAVDYITKPVSPAIVRARVQTHLRLKRATEQLRWLATTDVLTGVYNRHHFLELARKEESRVRRHGHATSIAMLDIDHFKRINDTHGHAAGDEALRRMVETCLDVLRGSDILGRMGGEEFALLLPHAAPIEAGVLADRLRRAVSALRVAMPGHLEVGFTVSIGVAPLAASDTPTVEESLKAADLALYDAKRQGRNRVVVVGTEVTNPDRLATAG